MDRCFLCKSEKRDNIKYGEFMTRKNISVHYYCLLLTSNLLQKGRDDQDFLGFLRTDIEKEAARVATAVCVYCKQKSANISCCARKCRRTFHLACGIEHNAENQFVGTFKSFCDRHPTGKKISPPTDENCCICYDELLTKGVKCRNTTIIRAPCCKNGWFHKWCLASFACTAGYYFKCPLCNDNKKFRERLVYKGIFIPDRDAAWEREPNAFAELLERPKACCAIVCNAKGGRSSSHNMNRLLFCGTCGSVVIHRKCLATPTDMFYCDECSPVIASVASVQNPAIVNITASQQTDTDDEVDVCNIDTDVPAISHTQIQDAEDEDEGTVQPLRRTKKNPCRIFDDDSSTTNDEDIIFSRKRTKRILSSDSENSSASKTKQLDSVAFQDAESLFDSGAESDHSGSSGEKMQTKDESLGDFKHIKYSLKDCKPNESVNNNRSEKRRFALLNDPTSGDLCVAKRTKRQSSCSTMALNADKTETAVTNLDVSVSRSRNSTFIPKTSTSISQENDKIGVVTSPSCNKAQIKSQIKSGLDPINARSPKVDCNELSIDSCVLHTNRRSSLYTNNEMESSKFVGHGRRRRTNSEDPSKSPSAMQRIRRRSFLQSPYSRAPSKEPLKCSEIIKVNTNSRGRSNSKSDRKRSSESGEIENTCQDFDTFRRHNSARDRSPLSSNLCSLYAYITPKYVRKNEATQQDAGSLVKNSPTNQHTTFETAKPFSLNDTNIPQRANKDAAKPESSATSSGSVKSIRSAQDIYLHSYNLIMYTEKPKPQKHRTKRNFIDHLPKNQTKIESFFRRI